FYHIHSAFGGGNGELYSLSPLTGVATLIGSTGLQNVLALALAGSAPPPPVVVPPPSVPTFTTSNDTLFGDAGNDTLFGAGGNDLIVGGADNDLLLGTAGNDSIRGCAGLDTLNGG